jgi:BON domain
MIQVGEEMKLSLVALVIALAYSLVSFATPAINDDTITDIVMSKLATDLGTGASRIIVNTSGGIVTLGGTVITADDKFEAEGITRNATGVTEVINYIQVNPDPTVAMSCCEKDGEGTVRIDEANSSQ